MKMHHYIELYVKKGTYNAPVSPDRRLRECVCDIGVSNLVMYSGVILLIALYVKTALSYLILLSTDIQLR